MSWGPNKLSLSGAALAAALLAAAPAAANVLVIRSSGPSAGTYPPGRSLPDNTRLALRANDTVIVLGAGGTRTFRGPGNFAVAGGGSGPRVATASDGRRARIGAVRSGGIIPRGPTIWHVDINQGGTFCLASPQGVMLWRADASSALRLTITPAGGRETNVNWPAGQATLAWPGGAPANGATYSFTQPGVAVPVQITFKTLASEPTDLEGVAAALIANGCQDQLDVLAESQPDLTSAR